MMQAAARRVVPRVALTTRCPVATQAVRFYNNNSNNQLQQHDGRRGNVVGNRNDWNDDFTIWNNWMGRWDPFADLGSFGKQVMRDDSGSVSTWRPRSTITETKEGDVQITAEMPGLSKDDISVDLHNGVLTIKGEKKEEKKGDTNGNYSKHKRSFFRSFSVPEDIDTASIKAKMEHGILEVTIPKPKEVEQKSTSITIQ